MSRLGVGTLQAGEDSLQALCVRRVEIRNVGIEVPRHGLPLDLKAHAFGVAVPRSIDVVENSVRVGPIAHAALDNLVVSVVQGPALILESMRI